MNDIEILENYLKYIKQFDNNSDFIPALENLIQRNKDLEEIEQEHKEENGRLRDRIKELEIEKENKFKRGFFTKVNESHKHTIKIESQVIPTSKLFKKIEKKIKLFKKMGFNEAYSALIDLYEELLEESEK